MGWASGSSIMSEVKEREELYRKLIEAFERSDWDTQNECHKQRLNGMTKEQAIDELNRLDDGDQEEAHIRADRILKDLLESMGYEDVVEAYNKAKDAVGFWYA